MTKTDPLLASFLRCEAKARKRRDDGIWELLEEAADAIDEAWEQAAKIAEHSAEVHRGAAEAETITGRTIRMIRIEEAEWIARKIRSAFK